MIEKIARAPIYNIARAYIYIYICVSMNFFSH